MIKNDVVNFINESPTAFNAVDNLKKELVNNNFIELLEKEIAKDSSVQGIFIEDASANAQTAAIARKLNYENIDNGRFRKYLLSDKKGKKLH